MNAGIDSTAFYVVDGNGNIAAIIDGTGITSFDFISKDVTSLNALYVDFQNHGIMINTINEAIDDIANNRIPALSSDIEALQARTKYLDASNDDDNTFYVVDKNGNIAMKVDINGVTSFNFTSQDVGDLNSLIGEVDNTIVRVGVLEETIPALKNETDDII